VVTTFSSFRFPELSQPIWSFFSLGFGKAWCTMPPSAILHEAQQLHNVSDRLDSLADQHPVVSDALAAISGSVRNTATLLEVLVATKMGPRSGPAPANAWLAYRRLGALLLGLRVVSGAVLLAVSPLLLWGNRVWLLSCGKTLSESVAIGLVWIIQSLGLSVLGWSPQTCDVNSLSRCDSKLRIISSKVPPVGVPEGLNRQPHSEQPKPRKRCCSIQTSFRLMAAHLTGADLDSLSGILHSGRISLGQARLGWFEAESIESFRFRTFVEGVSIAQY